MSKDLATGPEILSYLERAVGQILQDRESGKEFLKKTLTAQKTS